MTESEILSVIKSDSDDICDECGGDGFVTLPFSCPHDVPCPKCGSARRQDEEKNRD